MDTRLAIMAHSHGGVFSSGDAAAVGLTGNDLTRLVRSKAVRRLRRGAYALASEYDKADIAQRYRMLVKAVMRTRPDTDKASHHSALAMFGLGIYGAPLTTVVVDGGVAKPRIVSGLIVQPKLTTTYRLIDGVRVVNPATACAQVATRYGFTAGVCAIDSALHQKSCTLAELATVVEHLPPRQHRRMLAAIAAAEPLTESVGETRTRLILLDAGFTVVPQFRIMDGKTLVGRVDFLVDGCVVVEFDGMVKYQAPTESDGWDAPNSFDARRALAAEKSRESRISRLGYEVEQVIWSELDRPLDLVNRVTQAKHAAIRRREARAAPGRGWVARGAAPISP